MSNPLERTGLDLKELAELNAALKQTRQKNDKICICGHASGRHTWTEELQAHTCQPPRFNCECKKLVEVIKINRYPFIRFGAFVIGAQSKSE